MGIFNFLKYACCKINPTNLCVMKHELEISTDENEQCN